MSEKNFSSYGDMETLVTEISSKIASKTDKLKNTDSFYGTCSTAAGTAAKVVTLVNADNFSLRPGVTVTVKFSATNTAQNPTINVNGTGAKSVWYNTAAITTGSLWAAGGAVDRPVRYTYDGTYWVWMGQSTDADTTYSSISLQEIKTGTATNQRSVQPSVLNPAIKMYCPHYATCTSQAANQKKTIVVADTNFQLYTGCIIAIKFDANNTYTPTADAPVMFNVNSTGDKEVRGGSNVTVRITNTTSISVFGVSNRIISYQYDGTYWVKIGQSWDDNTTYTPQSLGFGYGTCTTAAATADKVATLSGYALVTNGFVSIKFSNDVPASATLNINSKGAKAIYNRGAAIAAGVIKAGDIATFVYSGQYHLISIDSQRAKNCIFNPTGTGLESTNAEDAIKELESNFQDGVDAVYDAVVAKGSTPASHSLSDVVQGIEDIETGITPSGIYTYPSGSTGGTVDVTNYAQVNAANVYEAGKKNPNFNISKITATQPATSYKTCILPTTGYYAVFTIVIDSTTPRIVRLVDCEEWKFLNNTAINIINSYNSKYLLVMYTVKANAANATLGAYIGAMGSSSFDVFVIKIKDL